jgi:hypothetical protein
LDYPLENLGPERFQFLCQALVAKEFPRVQCFPIGQPDGGRDAISMYVDDQGEKFMVFQVKFARNPLSETDSHKWLVAIMQEELPKVNKLVAQGASQYLLLTNIPGTAHLDSGSVDRLNKLMSDNLGIPFQCWWRNDINRRLDNAWSLKWVYPDLMTGPDFLRWIAETGLSEDKERRSAAVRAFLRNQYQMDEEVRFKQVELQNKLLDLFVDVPISFRESEEYPKQMPHFYSRLKQIPGGVSPEILRSLEVVSSRWRQAHVAWHSTSEKDLEAATLLLSDAAQMGLPRVVVEGAPGQGKSTIAQYICQVHRMRLLQETEVLNSIPEAHRASAVRLPIKVDLRDLATWMVKKDPFNVEDPNSAPRGWHKSLESFLAALISNQSGGTQFTTDDLLAVLRISSVVIVFDGLDEIADITRRNEVVDEIVKGTARIEENAASLQVIVTSRPAAFANSPGMPHSQYLYLQLLSLNRQLIMQYAERWLRARKLGTQESSEFRRVLKEKLDQPHLRDLARNPMQLAILLSLLLTRGASLPDKRTALYDYYMDLFFSREAEKSSIVRDHRDLLINIHRYLAWLLHSEAELGNSRASITQERLHQVVRDYLVQEGHEANLVNTLFAGMVERVVAIVSRVEGTFEFEVQPLREYFAACHLYYTAPQSSPGKEKTGSKPDRFDAISRNFYWLNVTRFYAGCYSKGELPSLVERLSELKSEDGFRETSYPRILSATLLTDWVFTQNPKSVQQLADLILEGVGFRYLVEETNTARRRASSTNGIVLPPKCGREELLHRGFVILRNNPPQDFQNDVIAVLRSHKESASDLASKWIEYYKASRNHEDRMHWISCGSQLGLLSDMPLLELKELIGSSFSTGYLVYVMLSERRLDYLESSEELFEESVFYILDRLNFGTNQSKAESAFDLLNTALDPHRYALALRNKHPVALGRIVDDDQGSSKLSLDPQLTTRTESYRSHKACLEFASVVESAYKYTGREWATSIEPWNRVVESGRSLWGDRWALTILAVTASGIRSSSEKCQEFGDLLDHSKSLCRRARYARLRSGSPAWWRQQFEQAGGGSDDVLLVALLCVTWATTPTLLSILDPLDSVLKSLSLGPWLRLYGAVDWLRYLVKFDDKSRDAIEVEKLPSNLSERTAYVLGPHADAASRSELFRRYFESFPNTDTATLEFIQREALDLQKLGTSSWKPNLKAIQKCYELGAEFPTLARRRESSGNRTMPADIATKIMESPDKYPGALVRFAEEYRRREVAKNIVPVIRIAERDRWFT